MATASSPDSVVSNVIPPMKQFGLIDEDGTLTERGTKWRSDATYGDACQDILHDIYPESLGELVDDDGRPDSRKVKDWFVQQNLGDSNATKMARTYVLIAGKQIPETHGANTDKTEPLTSRSKQSVRKSKKAEKPQKDATHEPSASLVRSEGGPTVHLDIQIHIPADATPEQIDKIFSSMQRGICTRSDG